MSNWAVPHRYIPLGDAVAKIGKGLIHAYLYDGIARADVDFVNGSLLTLDELRELQKMIGATIERLETSGGR